MTPIQKYIMDNKLEPERLSDQVIPEKVIKEKVSPVIKKYWSASQFKSDKFLETGCAAGCLTQAIANAHPTLKIVGIDTSLERIEIAKDQLAGYKNIELKQGDITALKENSNSYRYVFTRFVLEHINNEQQIAVNELYRVLEAGGAVILQSVDQGLNISYPEDSQLKHIKSILGKALLAHNYNPDTGRRLKNLAETAGFILESKPDIEVYNHYSYPVSEREYKAYELKLEIIFPLFVKAFRNEHMAKKAKDYLLEYVKRPDTLTYSLLFTVVGVKPEQKEFDAG